MVLFFADDLRDNDIKLANNQILVENCDSKSTSCSDLHVYKCCSAKYKA